MTKNNNYIDPDRLQEGEKKPEFILASKAKKLGIYTGKAYFECPHCKKERGKKGKIRYSPFVLKEPFRSKNAGEIVDFEKYGQCFSTSCSHHDGVYPNEKNGFRYSHLGFPILTNTTKKENNSWQKGNKTAVCHDITAEYFKEMTDYDVIDETFLNGQIFTLEDYTNKQYGVRVMKNENVGLNCGLMNWALSKGYQRDKIDKAFEELGIQRGPMKQIEKGKIRIYSMGSLCLLTDLKDRVIDGRILYLDPYSNKRFRNENFTEIDFPIENFFHDEFLHCYTPKYLENKQDSTKQGYRMGSTLFGLARLRRMIEEKGVENVKVTLQEGIKQTLVATLDLPKYCHLSTISEGGLREENIALLQRLGVRSVCLIPDKDFDKIWTKKAEYIMCILNDKTRLEKEHLDRIHLFVSSVLQNVSCLRHGEDTADL